MPTPKIGTPLYDTQKGEWVIFMFGVEDGLSYEWIAKNWRRDCKQRKEAA